MTSEETLAFKLLDAYARDKHQCFLAEFFANTSGSRYTACFRPMKGEIGSPGQYDCRYLYIEINEIKSAAEQKSLTPSMTKELDANLRALGDSA